MKVVFIYVSNSIQVVSSILQSPYGSLYNPENIYLSSDGGGAGNNWAYGYCQGKRIQEEVLDMLDREADNTDNFQVILLYSLQDLL